MPPLWSPPAWEPPYWALPIHSTAFKCDFSGKKKCWVPSVPQVAIMANTCLGIRTRRDRWTQHWAFIISHIQMEVISWRKSLDLSFLNWKSKSTQSVEFWVKYLWIKSHINSSWYLRVHTFWILDVCKGENWKEQLELEFPCWLNLVSAGFMLFSSEM